MEISRFVCADERAQEDVHDMRCALCHNVPFQPVECSSEHFFCRSCIDMHLSHASTCPIDNHLLTAADLRHNRIAERLVSRMAIHCRHRNSAAAVDGVRKRVRQPVGCRWVGIVRDLAAHEQRCAFREVVCPTCGLGGVLFMGLAAHHDKCEARRTECELCGEAVMMRELEAHYEECPEASVLCPNFCLLRPEKGTEVRLLKRRDVTNHLRECPKEQVGCEFRELGCEFRAVRGSMAFHMEEGIQGHLRLLKGAMMEVREVLRGARGSEEVCTANVEPIENEQAAALS